MQDAPKRRPRLQGFFSSFPEGWPGFGLVLLRLTVALNAAFGVLCALTVTTSAAGGGPAWVVWMVSLAAIVVAVALLMGLLTPLAGLAATIGCLVLAVAHSLRPETVAPVNPFIACNAAAIALALVVLGPGAYSLDARLFGRREIIIPEGRRNPRR